LYGDNCDRKWADYVLVTYVCVYVAVFIVFAFGMRAVVENFRIKEELKWTGLLAIAAVIPWLIFNNAAKSVNTTIFPFSTLFVVIAVSIAFLLSTLWPLYRSLSQAQASMLDMETIPDNLDTLTGILTTVSGVESFKKFLTKEFSVENILFYLEVEEFRNATKAAIDSGRKDNQDSLTHLMGLAQRVHAKYIMTDSPFQINLPDVVVDQLKADLLREFKPGVDRKPLMERASSKNDDEDDGGDSYGIRTPPTLFDAAQKNIFNLMFTDSLPRFFRSDLYKLMVEDVSAKRKKKDVLVEMNII
jgi:hypothetical protein